jgi:hypothetical protein
VQCDLSSLPSGASNGLMAIAGDRLQAARQESEASPALAFLQNRKTLRKLRRGAFFQALWMSPMAPGACLRTVLETVRSATPSQQPIELASNDSILNDKFEGAPS